MKKNPRRDAETKAERDKIGCNLSLTNKGVKPKKYTSLEKISTK